jgi:hypothetical protein
MAKQTARKTAPIRKSRAGLSSKPVRQAPTPDEIARRAFELFLSRGADHGNDLNDWLRAEHELRAQQN